MFESTAAHRPLRRTVLGPVAVTSAFIVLATAATMARTAPFAVGAGWVLAWLLLGLTAGYALSGSA